MLVTIRTLNAQRKVKVQTAEELDSKIKEIYKTEQYQLYSDLDKTVQIELQDIKDKMTVYMAYDMGEIQEYKPEITCTHSPDAVCPKCVDLDRSDRVVEPDKKVKYLSHGSYLQTLKDRSMNEEVFDYETKICDQHPSNQKCSKCMEKTITLMGQQYRYIDYVEFDSKSIVENFINRFKETHRQKIGLLVGRYAEYSDVPMGRKAVVSGIWEIEQECFPDGAVLTDIPTKFFTEELKILGVIYTDLIFKNGEICSHKRMGNYIVSTVELSFINFLREKLDNKALFGVCVAANDEKQVITEIFMVSEQFAALSKANAISLTTDPTKFKANREIVYCVIDEYGNKVSKEADPFFPVYYFIVKCENGFKENPLFIHNIEIKKPTLKKLSGYFGNDFRINKLKNFSILTSLAKYIPNNILGELIESVIRNDQVLLNSVVHSKDFISFKNELGKYDIKTWNCSACTYLNQPFNTLCEMCGTSKE
ncbi:uncharacterized protein VICG_00365 [Vittaforma corneae ATCC 50505]|uniref:Nuclear protein localization protein 4 n=1 Tax=Vittaforma corneae (strain ATCC 50505) TaxID=993615 RepID=L2GP22_VITCO|nr:uncharacterized protein VICG_00365 [Vittaforma corneae ATCC 50505]ELA42613.1 hypothetical protein VICG_00365 [Vittaforma corneae ATCC 50505]